LRSRRSGLPMPPQAQSRASLSRRPTAFVYMKDFKANRAIAALYY
jgi:hypothetical protein